MATNETLNYISQQLNIYVGITLLVIGVVGSLWNMLIFRHYYFRLSSCCIYMLVSSIASLIQIIFGLIFRILSSGFFINVAVSNIAWCKVRNYITVCASLTALSCFVWTAIDRLFSTCRQVKWRRLNSLYLAKEICLLTIIIWMLVNIPTIIYTQPVLTTGTCTITSIVWSKINVYFLNVFCYGIFPWLLTSIFGILTLRNLHHLHHRRVNPSPIIVVTRTARIDHQLTSMLFLQIIISIISSIPYCVQNIYDNLTQTIVKSEYRRAQENLFLQIVRLAFYLNYVSMFYVNYLSSAIFRRLSKKVVVNLFKRNDDVSREITVVHHQRNTKHIKRRQLRQFNTHAFYTTTRF